MIGLQMTALDDDRVLDAKAAACFLGIAVATLAKMRCKGGSPAFIKAGRKVLYLKQDLISWQNARRVSNSTQALSVPRRLTKIGLGQASGRGQAHTRAAPSICASTSRHDGCSSLACDVARSQDALHRPKAPLLPKEPQ